MAETIFPLQSVTKVIGLERVDSTQALAAELALKGEPEGTLVLACEQTEAFGRDGQPFYSAEGGVYFTLLLRPNKSEDAFPSLGAKMAGVIAHTLTAILKLEPKPQMKEMYWRGIKMRINGKKLPGCWCKPCTRHGGLGTARCGYSLK